MMESQYFTRIVREQDVASFEGKVVHPVYATFAIARDAEWVCRQFVLAWRSDDEEGIGSMVSVHHHQPAFVGDSVEFRAWVTEKKGSKIVCSWEALSGKRRIASGEQIQHLLPKTHIADIFEKAKAS